MARPPLPAHERRDDLLPNVRVTAAERVDVESRARAAGLHLSEFCRRSIFGQKFKPRLSGPQAEALAELNRIGVNLNQIARAMNAGRDLPASLEATLKDVRAAIAKVAGDGS